MINYNVDSDGIATITWDMPGRTMNVLNEGSIGAYAAALQKARGYAATVKAGQITYRNGVATGALPGGLVRSQH